MTETKMFASALQMWFSKHDSISARQIEQESGVKNLAQFRKGSRPVTYDAIAKLLPTIEHHSTRAAAVTLLIAYLTDETPPSHSDSISIQPLDPTGQPGADAYRALSHRWESKARLDPDFMAMWQGLDLYMHEPDTTTLEARYATQPRSPEADIALLADTKAEYKTKPRTK